MKAFVRHIALVVLGWLIIHTGIVIYIGQTGKDFQINDAGSTKERFEDFEKWVHSPIKQQRAIIVGSSTAYRNINPVILDSLTDYSWFNLASSSQTVTVSAALAKIALQRMGKIDLLLVDVYPEITDISNYEATYDWVNNSGLNGCEKWQLMEIAKLDLRLINAAYFRSLQLLFGWKAILQPTKNKGRYVGKGYAYSLKEPNATWPIGKKEKRVMLNDEITDLIAWAKANKIKVILNIAPDLDYSYTLQATDQVPNVLTHNEFTQQKKSYRLFYDSHHMTREGGERYSLLVGKKLANLFNH